MFDVTCADKNKSNNRLIWKFTTICKSNHQKAVVGLGGLPAAFLGCPSYFRVATIMYENPDFLFPPHS